MRYGIIPNKDDTEFYVFDNITETYVDDFPDFETAKQVVDMMNAIYLKHRIEDKTIERFSKKKIQTRN